ncbi:unnamed protein product [Larinioides sclopetarius]|uniref:Uncharacterized protein n=1 Tax=Larinioides sclopetarius TaxID=280406 RepID=A0AAV2BYR3_9ARAC
MKRPLAVTNLLFILIAYAESFESLMDEDEMYGCFYKLLCELDKVAEILEITRGAGPDNAKRYIEAISQATGVEIHENTEEDWIKFKEIGCKLPEEQRKKAFTEWGTLIGEYILDICQEHDSELCITADLAADQFATFLAKYKATGVCSNSGMLAKMMPGGMGKMGSSPFG